MSFEQALQYTLIPFGQIMNFKAIDYRISSLRIRGKQHKYLLILGHAPAEDKEESIKHEFYDQLEQTRDLVSKQGMLIPLGDFKAKRQQPKSNNPGSG